MQVEPLQVVGFDIPLFFSLFLFVLATRVMAILHKAGPLLRIERVTGWRLWHSLMRPSIQGVRSFVCVLVMHLSGVHHDHKQDDHLLGEDVTHVVSINVSHAGLGTSRKML